MDVNESYTAAGRGSSGRGFLPEMKGRPNAGRARTENNARKHRQLTACTRRSSCIYTCYTSHGFCPPTDTLHGVLHGRTQRVDMGVLGLI